MNRTVWLTAACLVLIATIAAGKLAKVPAAETTDKPVAEMTADADSAREPLIKADRLEVTYVGQEKPSQSTLQPISPIAPEAQKAISRRTSSAVIGTIRTPQTPSEP